MNKTFEQVQNERILRCGGPRFVEVPAIKSPSPLDLCETCKGHSNPDCRVHGIAAANARQNAFLRDYEKKYPDEGPATE